MRAIFQLFWDICLFRSGPEDVPTQRVFIGLIIVIYAVVESIRVMFDSELTVKSHILFIVFSLCVIMLATWGALRIWSLQYRFTATMVAIIGTDIIMSVIFNTYLYSLKLLGDVSIPEKSPLQMMAGVIVLLILIWDVVIKGFIFEKSLETSRLNGVFFSLALYLIVLTVGSSLIDSLQETENLAISCISLQELMVV